MNMISKLAAAAFLLLAFPGFVLAQAYPAQQVTIIVPFPAGSITDGLARTVADYMRRSLDQVVVVENKPGQDGALAARTVAHAEPDGHTILIGGNSTHSAAASLYEQLPYDPEKDFTAIGGIMKVPTMLLVRSDFAADNLSEFVAMAKDPDAELTFGSGNTSSRIAGELLKSRAGISMLHIPYRGIPQAMTDLLGGRIDVVFSDPASGLGMIKDGQVKALAVTSLSRMPALPDVPTIAESGYPDFEIVPWLGLFVPVQTPQAVVDTLTQVLAGYHRDDVSTSYFDAIAVEPFHAGSQELTEFLRADMKKWLDTVEGAGIEKN